MPSSTSNTTNRRATLRDVAQAAGVSVGAASDILNRGRSEYYTPATQDKVRQAVKELGYIPSRAAQNLRRGTTNTVAIIIPHAYRNPFYARVAEELDRHLVEAGLEPHFICLNGRPSRIDAEMPLLVGGGFEAVIAAPLYWPERAIIDRLSQITDFGIPTMVLGYVGQHEKIGCVQIPDVQAGEHAVAYLHSMGHTRIGLIGAAPEKLQPMVKWHYQGGIEKALETNDTLEQLTPWFFSVQDDGTYGGYLKGAEVFIQKWKNAKPSQRPTAMICKNDQAALAFLSACHHNQVKVPKDLSVLGYDNLAETAISIPALTSVDNRVHHATLQIVNELLKVLGREIKHNVTTEDLRPNVVQRDSVRKI